MNIFDIVRGHEQEIEKRFGVKRIGLFGSFARGEEKDSSDADITVEFVNRLCNFLKLVFYLEEQSPRKVECHTRLP